MQLGDFLTNLTTTLNGYLLEIGSNLKPILHDSLVKSGQIWEISQNFVNELCRQDPDQPLFSDFQLILLKTLVLLLFVNLVLILFFWRKYGPVITNKFIRPSTLKEIEELKLSVARLKLPKDYTPRI